MLCGRFQTLFFLVLLAVGLLMAASEKTSDEEPRECPAGSQAKTSTGDDDGEDDDEDQSTCVAALSLEPTEGDEPPVPPSSDEDGEDADPAESSTLIVHYDDLLDIYLCCVLIAIVN